MFWLSLLKALKIFLQSVDGHDLELELTWDSDPQASSMALDNALGWLLTAHKTGEMYSLASQ